MEKYELQPNLVLSTPVINPSAFVAPGAQVVGDVHIGDQSSVWYNSVLRADINSIRIGDRTNIQDGTIIHLENDLPCVVGNDVTVGHKAILHACTIEDGALIGMGAIILNGAVVKKGAMVAAGAVVKENEVVDAEHLWAGVPASPIKPLSKSLYEHHCLWAQKYVQLAQVHQEQIQ